MDYMGIHREDKIRVFLRCGGKTCPEGTKPSWSLNESGKM